MTPDLLWWAIVVVLAAAAYATGESRGVALERRRCLDIVDGLSEAEECCGRNFDAESDSTVTPCCGCYFRQCDGALALRIINGTIYTPRRNE